MEAPLLTGTILRSEAMQLIRSGQPFTMEFVTADIRRGTGGKLIKVENWQKMTRETVDHLQPHLATASSSRITKDAAHDVHKTFNIINPANPRVNPMKVHYRLIVTFNNKRVING